MAQPQRVATAPGPAGKSCLTCKRRHKKCDLRRPVCERCEKGNFECLGYSHNKKGETRPMSPESSRHQLNLPTQDNASNLSSLHVVSSTVYSEMDSLDNDSGIPTLLRRIEQNDTSSSPSMSCLSDQSTSTTRQADCAVYPSLEMPVTQNRHPPPAICPPSKRAPSPTSFLQRLFTSYNQMPYLPYNLSKTLLNSADLEDYMMTHCDRLLEYTYLKPVHTQTSFLQRSMMSRSRGSGFTRWATFLCAKIRESCIRGDTSQNNTHDLWFRQVEQALRGIATESLAPSEMQNRLGNWLEVLILKVMFFHSSNAYRVLRDATPIFLQMLFSEPTLWPSDCDLTSVPLANVIAFRRHELVYFALVDITASMTLGVPQQVEYNTSLPCPPNGSAPHEWVHCAPIEFQITLAEINACRDKSPNARGWEEIEHRLITWQARPNGYDADLESWVAVTWLAVQESWRHTLLVYLYLAVCGASSDDPRIQSSVRQIFSVIGTVKKRESPNATAPLSIQYLVAGICARSEKHRSLARQHLANITPRLMRAADFVPVLDHLWHGVAAGGRPVTWSDYLRSRETMLPVLM